MRTFFAFVETGSSQSALEQALAYHAEASAGSGPRIGSAEEFVLARRLRHSGSNARCSWPSSSKAGGLNYVRLVDHRVAAPWRSWRSCCCCASLNYDG